MPTEKSIMEALSRVMDPELNRSLVELGMIQDLKISAGRVSLTIALTAPGCPLREQIAANTRAALLSVAGVKEVALSFRGMTDEERKAAFGKAQQAPLPKLAQMNQVRQVIAVMSGKGGVGKSSVTALLAVALSRAGQKVGVLDADITGPSIPRLFGLPTGGLRGGEQGMLPAVTRGGIKVVSTNLLLKEEHMPVVWRGPMIAATIKQFWTDALWGRLDTLLVDMPPGTSDAAISVMQNLPVNGVILVTTPQELAGMVVRKAVVMLRELKVPILGLVENMSYFPCPETGVKHEVFGPSHAAEVAQAAGVELWARLPLDARMAPLCDSGKVEEVESAEVAALAQRLLTRLPA